MLKVNRNKICFSTAADKSKVKVLWQIHLFMIFHVIKSNMALKFNGIKKKTVTIMILDLGGSVGLFTLVSLYSWTNHSGNKVF